MKNKYDDALGETFLKSAFNEAAELEFSEIGKTDVDIKYPTEKQQREIERAMSKNKNTTATKIWRAVAMIAIVFCLTFGVLMLQPSVRASVLDVVITFFEDYLNIELGSSIPSVNFPLGDYTITYIPEGYMLTDSKDTLVSKVKTFSSGENELVIYYYDTPYNKVNVGNENLTEVTIGDLHGCFIEYQNPNINNLIWGNENYYFSIRSTLSKKEMIKIAENIK